MALSEVPSTSGEDLVLDLGRAVCQGSKGDAFDRAECGSRAQARRAIATLWARSTRGGGAAVSDCAAGMSG